MAGYFEHIAPSGPVDDQHLEASTPIRYSFVVNSDPHLALTDVHCFDCPFGGYCNDGIQTTRNKWGVRNATQVIFYRCPAGYCCGTAVCSPYDYCMTSRQGTLCGRCKHGYSEALFSTICIANHMCKDYWFLSLCFFLAFIYALFLLFQTNIKNLIFGPSTRESQSLVSILKARCLTRVQSKEKLQQPQMNTGQYFIYHLLMMQRILPQRLQQIKIV